MWSTSNLSPTTLLGTMIPQIEGVLGTKRMLDELNIKQISGLKIETITRLCRLVVKNNYFTYNGKFYHKV